MARYVLIQTLLTSLDEYTPWQVQFFHGFATKINEVVPNRQFSVKNAQSMLQVMFKDIMTYNDGYYKGADVKFEI